MELELEGPRVRPQRAPAVAARETGGRPALRAGPLAQDLLRDGRGHRQRQPQRLAVEQNRALALDECRVELRLREGLGGQHAAQELHVGRHAHDVHLGQRRIEPGQRLCTRGAVHDQLGDHRVVEGRDLAALAHAVVHAHAAALEGGVLRRLAVDVQGAGGGQEVVVGVLGADACLDRMAVDLQLLLLQRQRLAGGDAQLPFDEVQARDRFRHRVLDLQARVHLHEIKLHGLRRVVAARLLDDEFDGSRTDIVDGARCVDGRLAHLPAHRFGHAGRGRFLQHLLVAALHRAVALEQVDAVPLRVAEDLDLDVARALHVLLDQHRVAAEAVDRLTLATRERSGEVFASLDDAHALAAAARAGLDERGIADAVGLALQQRRVLVGAVVAGHQGHAGLFHQALRFGLQAHRQDRLGRRADEHQPRLGAGACEVLVLRQEAVAGVDGFGPGRLRGLDDLLPPQVAVLGRTAAQVHRLVAGADMVGMRVGIGIHGDGVDCHAAGRRCDPTSDLAPVGDQDLLKHSGCLPWRIS